jgi:hypothetical protein
MSLRDSEQMNKIEVSRSPSGIRAVALTSFHWKDFVALLGPNGACAGCWCMYERLTERNKRAMKAIVESGRVPGLLAYLGDEPVGWCQWLLERNLVDCTELMACPILQAEIFGRWSVSSFTRSIEEEGLLESSCKLLSNMQSQMAQISLKHTL